MPNGNIGTLRKVDLSETFAEFCERTSTMSETHKLKPQTMRMLYEESARQVHYTSETYHVAVDKSPSHGFPGATIWYLSIKLHTREPVMDWRDLQAIKTTICGAEAEAVQLFPAESRVVDTANQYHLFAFMKMGGKQLPRLPIGWQAGARTDTPGGVVGQRPGATP